MAVGAQHLARSVQSEEEVHVFLHDGMLRRLGRLRAFNVTFSYLLGRAGAASFSVPFADPLLTRLDPDAGATIVVETASYSVPWVGYVSELMGGAAVAAVEVRATEYSGLLEQRYLPNHFETSGALGDEFRCIIDTMNGRNQTLIRLGAVENRAINVGGLRLSNLRVWEALDLLAGVGLMEWFVDYSVAGGAVEPSVHLVGERGADRTNTVEWSTGPTGDAVLQSWSRVAGALPAVSHVIGGDATGTETFDEHPRSTSVSTSGAGRGLLIGRESRRAPETVHGYARFLPKASTPATRLESLILQSEAETDESVLTTAEALASRPTFAERTAMLTLSDAAALAGVELGDVASLRTDGVPALGPASVARLMGVIFDSRSAGVRLECEVLGGRT